MAVRVVSVFTDSPGFVRPVFFLGVDDIVDSAVVVISTKNILSDMFVSSQLRRKISPQNRLTVGNVANFHAVRIVFDSRNKVVFFDGQSENYAVVSDQDDRFSLCDVDEAADVSNMLSSRTPIVLWVLPLELFFNIFLVVPSEVVEFRPVEPNYSTREFLDSAGPA